jgi:ribosome-associated protein
LRHDRLRAVECNTYIDIGFQEEYLDSITLARQIVDAIEEKQATAIVLMDVHELTNIAAYFVIATVDNDRQAKAIEDSLLETLKLQQNIRPLHAEGLGGQGGGWSILDYGDVIVHLFTEEMREYYKLEELWSKAQVLVKML